MCVGGVDGGDRLFRCESAAEESSSWPQYLTTIGGPTPWPHYPEAQICALTFVS